MWPVGHARTIASGRLLRQHALGRKWKEDGGDAETHREAAAIDGEGGAVQRWFKAVEQLPQNKEARLQTHVLAAASPASLPDERHRRRLQRVLGVEGRRVREVKRGRT
jgi:hypothetical protein